MINNKKRYQQLLILVIFLTLGVVLVFVSNFYHTNNEDKYSETFEGSVKKPETDFVPEIKDSLLKREMTAIEILLGKVIASEDNNLVVVPAQYASREGIYMQQEALDSFLKMHKAASTDGISLMIISGFRSFDHQKRIWENKWNGRQILHGNIKATDISDHKEKALEILKYSAMPGTSRHHWGTDIDLNSLNNSYFAKGEGKKVYDWLSKNAIDYGFCQPYTSKSAGRQSGYEEEKWHWSYIPLANIYLKDYKRNVDYNDIKGFDGWQTAEKINVIEKFVISINKDCLE